MIDDQLVSDRQGFVVAVTPLQADPWDESLKHSLAVLKDPNGWTFYRTSPHPLTGLKSAEIAFQGRTGLAVVSIYATFESLFPEHTHVTNVHNPLGALKRVLEID